MNPDRKPRFLGRTPLSFTVAAFIGLASIAGDIKPVHSPIDSPAKPAIGEPLTTPPQTEAGLQELVIQAFADNLQIIPNQEEISTWERLESQVGRGPFRSPNEEVSAASQRFYAVYHLMKESNNPFFYDAAEKLTTLMETRKISLEFVPTLILKNGQKAAMVVYPIAIDGKVGWHLIVSIDQLHNPNVTLGTSALTLTHEMKHIDDAERYLADFQDLSQEEQVDLYLEHHRDPQNCLEDEISAVIEAARAYRYHYDLGYRGSFGTSYQLDAFALAVSESLEDGSILEKRVARGYSLVCNPSS